MTSCFLCFFFQVVFVRLSVCQDVWFLVLGEKNQTEMLNRFSVGLSRVQNSGSNLKFNFVNVDYNSSNEDFSMAQLCNVAASR